MGKSATYETVVPVQIKISASSLLSVTIAAAVVSFAAVRIGKAIGTISSEAEAEIRSRASRE